MHEYPPAVIAAADQLAAAYNDMIERFPKLTATFEATFDADVYQRLMDTLPLTADMVGGPLDGFRWQFQPKSTFPEMLVFEIGAVQHWYRRVVCDWWTCYEWVRDLDAKPLTGWLESAGYQRADEEPDPDQETDDGP